MYCGGYCSRLLCVVFQVLTSELSFLGNQDSRLFFFFFGKYKAKFKSMSGDEFLSLLKTHFSFPMSVFLDLRYKRLKEKLLKVLLILNLQSI